MRYDAGLNNCSEKRIEKTSGTSSSKTKEAHVSRPRGWIRCRDGSCARKTNAYREDQKTCSKKLKNMLFDPSRTPPGAPRGLFLRVEQPQKVGAKKICWAQKSICFGPPCTKLCSSNRTPRYHRVCKTMQFVNAAVQGNTRGAVLTCISSSTSLCEKWGGS